MTKEFILSGFGGQGILFAGKVLANFGLISGCEVSWLPSYGPEMRGGTANCSVCISDEPICSPLVTDPDILITMNKPSYDKFINSVKPGGMAIIDSFLVKEKCSRKDIKCFYVPSTFMATENGISGMANIILLGKLVKETGIATAKTIRNALEKIITKKKANLIDLNLKAIEIGCCF